MDYLPSSIVAGFRVAEVSDLPDYRGQGILLEHIRTGFKVYFVRNDDRELLFQAFLLDPLMSLDVDRAKELFDRMYAECALRY